MAPVHTDNHFGDISIAGSAKAHLGDKHTHNTYYICRAVFTAQEKAEHNAYQVSGKKRLRDGEFQKSLCDYTSKRRCVQTKATETVHHDSASYETHLPKLQTTSTQNADALLESSPCETQASQQILREAFALLPHRSNAATDLTRMRSDSVAGGLIGTIVEKVKQAFQTSMPPWLSLTTTASASSYWVANTDPAESNSQNRALISSRDNRKPVQELAALILLLISCASYRTLSSKDMSKVVARLQEDKLLPLWTWLLGIGIARYLYFGHITYALSGLNGDCITLEDAFQLKRRVPMSTCEDYSILKAFLEVHYRGRAGEPLVKADKFNMTLNSRRGLALRRHDWSTKGRVPVGARVVMSVFLTTDDARCTACQMSLDVTPMGEFFCQSCNRFYRDCDALQFFTSDAFPLQIPVATDAQNQPVQLEQRIEEIDSEDEDEANPEHKIDSLKNIDLRILPRQKKRHVSPALEDDRDNSLSHHGDEGVDDSDVELEDGERKSDAGTSPFAFHQSPSYHSSSSSSSYLPKLEARFTKDLVCCGMRLSTLHDLLQHYEETHAQREPVQTDGFGHPATPDQRAAIAMNTAAQTQREAREGAQTGQARGGAVHSTPAGRSTEPSQQTSSDSFFSFDTQPFMENAMFPSDVPFEHLSQVPGTTGFYDTTPSSPSTSNSQPLPPLRNVEDAQRQAHVLQDSQMQLMLLELQNKRKLRMARQDASGFAPPFPTSDNHALQDFQLKLMLLEQQNKRKLMMARRQEERNISSSLNAFPGDTTEKTGFSSDTEGLVDSRYRTGVKGRPPNAPFMDKKRGLPPLRPRQLSPIL